MKSSYIRLFKPVFAVILGAIMAGLCLHASAGPRPRFTVTDLGTLPGLFGTFPRQINNHGQVVGDLTDGATRRAFLYSDGVMTEIPVPPDGYALSINDAGMVVGSMSDSSGFLYSDGKATDLNPIIGNDYVGPTRINDTGQIVGILGRTEGGFRAFWLSNGVVGFFPLPPDRLSFLPYDINNAAQTVGSLAVFTNSQEVTTRAALFQNGSFIDLGTLPGGTFSVASAISESGDVVGWSGLNFRGPPARNTPHAFLYRDGRMTDLGTLPGHILSAAHDVNSAGWVVGWSEFSEEDGAAFLHVGGKMYDLNDLVKGRSDLVLRAALSVNERGQIVGWGMVREELRGFLLTPLKPQPRQE